MLYFCFIYHFLERHLLIRRQMEQQHEEEGAEDRKHLGAEGACGCRLVSLCSRRSNSALIISCTVWRRSMRSSWILRFSSRRCFELSVFSVIILCTLTLKKSRLRYSSVYLYHCRGSFSSMAKVEGVKDKALCKFLHYSCKISHFSSPHPCKILHKTYPIRS